ncbi:MAG: hypothetical protein ABH881_01365 [bacterium]
MESTIKVFVDYAESVKGILDRLRDVENIFVKINVACCLLHDNIFHVPEIIGSMEIDIHLKKILYEGSFRDAQAELEKINSQAPLLWEFLNLGTKIDWQYSVVSLRPIRTRTHGDLLLCFHLEEGRHTLSFLPMNRKQKNNLFATVKKITKGGLCRNLSYRPPAI